ncbi:M81 family metallopeptidase [Neobacillus sp. PS3-12]|jgi:microcystin degradation protein MlrC|uniref:M81 family metallopeptidase n=1 Tax=Neobacillus sp. PS3-12 TaxID=3070677 RepID=UPI0027DED8FD|nr:M81 family metallopeptidase [Neobacillus sp. PS3-12]WML51336.1 M81 family metallopeptidase [Neobacillus sp. PS3-12]
MRNYRVGIAFFYHESHSFSPMKTEIEQFRNEGYFIGNEIYDAYLGTKTEVSGFLDVLKQEKDVEIVPLICAAAIPSGVVSTEAYSIIENQMLESIKQAGRLDGLLLALHGAMVVEDIFDPEEHLLGNIRKLIGPNVPIATTLDMHANLSEKMIHHTPLHFGFKTYPHVDMYDQGVRASKALMKQLKEGVTYYASFEKLPMMPPSINMRTAEGPMHKMIERAKQAEEDEGVYNVSVFGGFPYSDIPIAGASILVVSLAPQKGKEIAKKMASLFWSLREEFIIHLPSVKEGLDLALSIEDVKPVVLADISDNPLSCGSGDTTELLREMVKLNIPDTLFGGLYDPESIEACRKAGAGKKVWLSLGGKVSPEFGEPVQVEATVVAISDGIFHNSGPFNQHLKVDLKGAAHIRVGRMDILLIGRPMSANDPEMFRHIGLEPSTKKILALKAKNHFRAAFEPLVGRIIYVDAPGVASNRLTTFTYRYIPRPIWPLDDVQFEMELKGERKWKR